VCNGIVGPTEQRACRAQEGKGSTGRVYSTTDAGEKKERGVEVAISDYDPPNDHDA